MTKNLKQVVILSGGKGTRMREMTTTIPKPMVEVGGLPVLDHLMNIFKNFYDFEFIVCSGYKSEIIEDYFKTRNNVKVIYTGEETNTGGRLFKVRQYLNENFLITYGDGLANVNINNLIDFHFNRSEIGTVTVTNPISRFGLVEFDKDNIVRKFKEKPKLSGYINIGFMVFSAKIFEYLDEKSTLESDPLLQLSNDGELNAFVHDGFFEPMDTYREYLNLNKLWDSGQKPWTKF